MILEGFIIVIGYTLLFRAYMQIGYWMKWHKPSDWSWSKKVYIKNRRSIKKVP